MEDYFENIDFAKRFSLLTNKQYEESCIILQNAGIIKAPNLINLDGYINTAKLHGASTESLIGEIRTLTGKSFTEAHFELTKPSMGLGMAPMKIFVDCK